eukprot:TRINITY_DN25767_c0_g1_i1.p2 TRINITY_DN25767_c0_g1~~TRINITY_DN25767_c0_g1_i1.p2  ORF type:complete len:121 (-),score=15.70 TRINITY_DN25767_c0_g1_i1:4-366(-)
MNETILELKKQIIEVLNLEDICPEDIDENAPLFGGGLGLDSIDALELIVLMAVSYTHLTLPTICSVQISVVAVSLKKKTEHQTLVMETTKTPVPTSGESSNEHENARVRTVVRLVDSVRY